MRAFNAFLRKINLLTAVVLCPVLLHAQDPDAKAPIPPTALRPDIKVEHFMTVGPEAVRLIQHPGTGDIYYTTFTGDVFRVKLNGQPPVAEKVFSAEDHGITRLQGAAFLKNTLFLAGNISVNDNKGTKGRMVRYDLASGEKPELTVVFNTVEYGTNKTTFDHGWNALEISPDQKYIYVNTGARTDHGEVQDNGGVYPNARDNALTAKIFRFPVDAKNLELPNDEAKLKADGYIYAEGIRNAYDMAFDGDGRLFAVSNSGDYDHAEDMFWVQKGHHYGFPWVMGGIDNPQQNPDWQPDPEKDPFLSKFAHAWLMRYFRNDPEFPKKPAGVKFTGPVLNMGPDANEYRDRATGVVMDGDTTGVPVGTFNAHSSPLALFFDTRNVLADDLKGDGFVIRYSGPRRNSTAINPLKKQGRDLLHLDLTYNKTTDNYSVKTTRLVDGFTEPTDALLVGNTVYVIEYGGKGGNLWKITLPADPKAAKKQRKKSKLTD
ncbi:cytochrome c class I [Larkinella humicola]|uniref:Cytochrome c class I n=1 Tax=Larkinella humicola TaxID=2607654 RepID=A0A5N1JQA8_9BACT|nr:cytochrome c class I [Larkinella humicola]